MVFILDTALAENGDFAELCEACQLKFIGPSYQSIQKMGIKDIAKAGND